MDIYNLHVVSQCRGIPVMLAPHERRANPAKTKRLPTFGRHICEEGAVNFLLNKVGNPYIIRYVNHVTSSLSARKAPFTIILDLHARTRIEDDFQWIFCYLVNANIFGTIPNIQIYIYVSNQISIPGSTPLPSGSGRLNSSYGIQILHYPRHGDLFFSP